tara:strand:+ start:590 stop:1918 length:1329 start_codon:yes stop_codon:yes gene_type:complete
MKNNFESKKTYSFDKTYSSNIFFKEPDKYREIEKFSKLSKNIITSGSNFSYSPAGFGRNSLSLALKKFNRILDFNFKNKEITVESGLTLSEFLNFLLKYDLWIPQLPGYPFITLGGAVAANSHGKSCGTHGTIRNSIKSILLFHKKNGWLELSEDNNKDIFDLTIGGLGLTGTIVSITFKLSDLNYKKFLTTKEEVGSTRECVELIKKNNYNDVFIYSWNRADNEKDFGKGFVFKNTISKKGEKTFKEIVKSKNKSILNPPFSIWNKFTIQIANLIFFNLNKKFKKKSYEGIEKVIFPFLGKENYFNFFGQKGFIESQLLISHSKLDEFFDEFMTLYKLHKPIITLFSIKNMSGNQKYLRFEDNKLCITFDYVNNSVNLMFMTEIDKLCVKYKILPSIIKDSRISQNTFDSCYEYAQKFRDELKSFDNERIYKSELSSRLKI